MRIRRGPLFWGLFLIPIGAIQLLERSGLIDPAQFDDAWRFWPLALVAIGLVILLGRTRAGLAATGLVAILFGSLVGGVIAASPNWAGGISSCTLAPGSTEQLTRDGTFAGRAQAAFDLGCGSLDLSTGPGDNWTASADYRGPAPTVEAGTAGLEVRSATGAASGRQDWTVVLPADRLDAITLQANASTSMLRLDGADLSNLKADVNAGDLAILASAASVDRIDAAINAGRIRVTLGPGSTSGELSANAGVIDLCVPPDATLQLHVIDDLTFGTNLQARGLVQSGSTWTRDGTSGATIELTIEGNAASLTLDPDGGCDE